MSSGRAPRRRSALLAATAVAGVLILSACSGGTKAGGGGNTNFVTGSGGISTVAKADRTDAPKLDGTTLDGKDLAVADYKGKVVVLNFWGSWCGPCRAEAKHFEKVAKATEAQGVQFVGVNTRDPQKSLALSFEKDFGVTYPSIYDPTGKLLLRFPKGTLNPQAIPSTVVIDRDGKLAARSLAALDAEKLRKMIDPLVAEK
ncbi:Thiol-disulfide isomerase or thioredoxin [Streptomyces sp. LamerLS-316]|uniref:TlpA family protein disulfide reductase n=2 Tax=Streptomyces TaxID=1883 RepID=A0A652KTH3_9ACTN|nr:MULTISPECIES: TlpA disulfide reductase family protein [unclassified Streptomyces]WSS62575.1 TlpA family protein disulfide reductase [Streptomyces sp. NBC_01177]WSS69575.1 TlpA family protein disulfide reductase [Streptomyces sp. NBC_01175]WSS76590.1 TlpA family protein disulfide reductase [Streptomyces sp. NBC_01174]MDX3053800.1 TlpA disulfide reductase family protein [Streptomyces sp. NE06-03E]MDX3324797.1 TlpA disulfide reductase family protein [Streptomyces sp. ME02-6979-3A]